MRFIPVVAGVAIGAIALAACGTGSSSSGASKRPAAVPVTALASGVAVQTGDTSLGKVLVSPSGLTMYGLMKDTKTASSCTGACAMAWPPVLVGKGWAVGNGLDKSGFSTIVRSDGTRQLVAGNWPLYTFSGDTKAGDVNGEGSGGVWFAVGTDGKLVKSAPASPAMATVSSGY